VDRRQRRDWHGGGVTTSASAADNMVAVYTAASNLEGTSGLTFDGTTLTVGAGAAGTDYIIASMAKRPTWL